MFFSRIKASLVGLTLTLLFAQAASAQLYQPFIDPNTFHSDFQFFAPADFDDYGGEFKPKYGWFGGWDRMYVWVTRDRQLPSKTTMDHTWGNRFDFGYMTEEDHGWLFGVTHIDGPNANDYLTVELINRVQGGVTGANAVVTTTPVYPISDRNTINVPQRTFDVTNSLNNANLSNFEINKTFRLDPSHNGVFIEPFIGVRYTRFVDFTRNDTYNRYDVNGLPVGLLPQPPLDTAIYEQIVANTTQTLNDMFGGQLGARVFKQQHRWQLSGEVRVFAMQNFQTFSGATNISTAEYTGIPATDPILYAYAKQTSYDHKQEFVVGTDVRLQAAIALTRDISFRFSANFTDFGRGISRGPNTNFNQQDVQIAGLGFGLNLNY